MAESKEVIFEDKTPLPAAKQTKYAPFGTDISGKLNALLTDAGITEEPAIGEKRTELSDFYRRALNLLAQKLEK